MFTVSVGELFSATQNFTTLLNWTSTVYVITHQYENSSLTVNKLEWFPFRDVINIHKLSEQPSFTESKCIEINERF